MTCADLHPVAFVVSLNLHRRHLSESQRGMVAAKLANVEFGQYLGNQHQGSANLQTPPVSHARAAQMLNVSTRTVAAASKVKDEGAPELVAAVERGEVSVSAAATIAEVPDQSGKFAGLPRTNADKRNAVRLLLGVEAYAKASDQQIAKVCRVSPPTVASVRDSVSLKDLEIAKPPAPTKEVIRNGKTYERDTAKMRTEECSR